MLGGLRASEAVGAIVVGHLTFSGFSKLYGLQSALEFHKDLEAVGAGHRRLPQWKIALDPTGGDSNVSAVRAGAFVVCVPIFVFVLSSHGPHARVRN